MASNIKFKRSAVQNRVPTAAQLELGELALNTFDGKLYTEINTGSASVVEIGSILSSLAVNGDNGGGGGDVVFHGATTNRDLTWDYSDDSLKLADNTKIKIGNSQDLEIFCDGTHSKIVNTNTSGYISILTDNFRVQDDDGSQNIIRGFKGADVELYFNNLERLTTTLDGVDIGGTGSLKVPVGTTAQRNSSPAAGDIRYNSTLGSFEGYSSSWGELGGGGVGIGSTSTNPSSGVVGNRIGVGFTDINIVGTGVSVTGYGTTIVIDFNDFKPGSFHRTIHNYTATAGQTTFGGLNYVTSEKQIAVYLNGARLSEATYTATSGTTVVLDVGASVGDEVEIINIHTNSDVDRKVNTYTATAGQTTFTGLSYNSKQELDVYLNGIRLASADFTATSGNTVVLAVGASVNDTVDIVSTGDGITFRSTSDASGDRFTFNNLGIGTDQTPDALNVGGNVNITGVTTSSGGVRVNADGSSSTKYISVGASDDLKLYHAGGNSIIHNSTGYLELNANAATWIKTTQFNIIDNDATHYHIRTFKDDRVELFHNNSKKFETTAYGTNTTGTAVNDGMVVAGISTHSDHIHLLDSKRLRLGSAANGDAVLLHDGTDTILDNQTGNLFLRSATHKLQALNAHDMIVGNTGGSVELYHNNLKKLETTSTGIELTSTDAGAAAAPTLRLQRDSSSPANQDVLGQVLFGGKDSNGADENYASVAGKIIQAGGGGEHGAIQITTRKASANVITANLTSTDYELLNGTNLSVDGNITGNSNFTLTSTDTGATAAPELTLHRNSSSPADADYLGQIKFSGKHDGGSTVNYAKITGKILDASNGTEDGILEFAHIKAGSQTITGRWRSDSLQLLNGTSLTVAGTADVTGALTGTTASFSGNVSIGGTLTYEDVTNVDSVGVVTARSGVHITGDNKYLKIGEGDDLQFVHTGSETYIANLTGHLTRRSNVHKWENYAGNTHYGRFDSSGRFLLGTTGARIFGGGTSPHFQMEGLSEQAAHLTITRVTNDSYGSVLGLAKSRGTSLGSNTIVQDNDTLGVIQFRGTDGSDIYSVAASIHTEVDGSPSDGTDMPGALVLGTTVDGASSPTQRLRIASNGKIHLNYNASSSAGADRLNIMGGGDGISIARSTANASDNNILGNISFHSYMSGSYHANAEAKIEAVAEPGQSGSNAAARLLFYTKDSGVSPGSSPTTKMTILSGGSVNIGGDYTQTTHKLKVTGSFAATTKSFVIDHPTKENHKLQYACLEGPENSVYVRGRSSDPVIELPDYWIGLVHENSITVNVTPIGNKNVWVESINNNSVTIGTDGSTEYFYTVFAERKDVEKLEVEVQE